MDPDTPVTEAAAFSRTSNLRPVTYTFAPAAAKAFAMLSPLYLTRQQRIEIKDKETYIPVPPPVTKPTRPERDIVVATLRSAMFCECRKIGLQTRWLLFCGH